MSNAVLWGKGTLEGRIELPGDELIMLIYATVLFTILSALGFGVISGYVLIIGIFHLFRHNSAQKKRPRAATTLRAATAHASGD